MLNVTFTFLSIDFIEQFDVIVGAKEALKVAFSKYR